MKGVLLFLILCGVQCWSSSAVPVHDESSLELSNPIQIMSSEPIHLVHSIIKKDMKSENEEMDAKAHHEPKPEHKSKPNWDNDIFKLKPIESHRGPPIDDSDFEVSNGNLNQDEVQVPKTNKQSTYLSFDVVGDGLKDAIDKVSKVLDTLRGMIAEKGYDLKMDDIIDAFGPNAEVRHIDNLIPRKNVKKQSGEGDKKSPRPEIFWQPLNPENSQNPPKSTLSCLLKRIYALEENAYILAWVITMVICAISFNCIIVVIICVYRNKRKVAGTGTGGVKNAVTYV